jgi:hypothetical protein
MRKVQSVQSHASQKCQIDDGYATSHYLLPVC